MGLNYPEGLTGGFGNILCLVVIEWTLQQHKQTSKKRTLASTTETRSATSDGPEIHQGAVMVTHNRRLQPKVSSEALSHCQTAPGETWLLGNCPVDAVLYLWGQR